MARNTTRRGRMIPALVACFYIGIVVGWLLRDAGRIRQAADPTTTSAAGTNGPDERIESADPREPNRLRPDVARATTGSELAVTDRDRVAGPGAGVVPTTGPSADNGSIAVRADPIPELRRRGLRLPIDDARIEAMKGDFTERRGGGARGHEAVDILADRNTPVRAIEDGTIARLFVSKLGGLTIYQFDPTGRFNYYYAHLERYANGLREGQRVSAGDVIGYVGTSGNAPKNTPHLHFAISELGPDKRWWEGRPLDPYLVYKTTSLN
jgi:murein DD-endopeptidase MepM/ murein hydrolase activator NlpD